jgi:hypothetical protein
VAIYAGFYLDHDNSGYLSNMTLDEKEDVHKNWLHYNDTYMIDIPPSHSNLIYYRASLGHKVSTINPVYHSISSVYLEV